MDFLGSQYGLGTIILVLIMFHIAALVAWVVLLAMGSKPVKKVEEKQH